MSIPSAQAYLYNAPSGVPGDVTRPDESNVEPIKYASGQTPAAFGIPMVYDGSGNALVWGGSNVAADFQGILVREAPQIDGGNGNELLTTAPYPAQVLGICVRGYISVLCVYGTPVRGGIVYVRTVANANGAVGDFNATSDSSNSVALSVTQAEWASNGKDANNNAEIRLAR